MANRRRTLGIKIETPGGDNPLRMRLANKRPNAPIYAGIDIGDRLALVGQGGHPPYSFSIISGGDTNGGVNGLTLHTDGTFEGTPEDSGRFAFVAEVQDSSSATFPASFSLTFLPQLVWVRFEPVPGENLLHYSYRMLARDLSGNDITTGYTLVAGNLPDGLTIHDNGIIDGDPSFAAIGLSYATIRAQGVGGHLDVNIIIEIFPPFLGFSVEDPVILYATAPFDDYIPTSVGTGGSTPYRYRWDNLDDFPWLKFDYNTGKFSGTPPLSNIGFEQRLDGTVTDRLGADLPVDFRFRLVYAQQGFDLGGSAAVYNERGLMTLESDDGSIAIEQTSSGGINLRATGVPPPPGSGGIDTINGIGPDSSGDLQIDGIGVDSNGNLYVIPGSGGVASVTGTAPISVDNTDPANPVVTFAPASPAKGDILVYDGSHWVKHAHGADGQIIRFNASQTDGLENITSSLLPFAPLATEILADSPLCYYKLNETSGNFIDYGSAALNLTPVGTSPANYVQAFCRQITTTSDKFLRIASGAGGASASSQPTGLTLVGPWTVCAIFSTRASSSPTRILMQLNNNAASSNAIRCEIGTANTMNVAMNAGSGGGLIQSTPGMPVLPIGIGTYIFHFTKDNSTRTFTFWVNGIFVGSATYSAINEWTGTLTSPKFSVGNDHTASNGAQGILSNVALFGSVLTEARIVAHAQAAGLYANI